MITDLQQRISAMLSRSAPQVGTAGAGAVGSRTGGPCSAAMDAEHEMRPRRASGPRVRAYEVRECCGGVVRTETMLVRCSMNRNAGGWP